MTWRSGEVIFIESGIVVRKCDPALTESRLHWRDGERDLVRRVNTLSFCSVVSRLA